MRLHFFGLAVEASMTAPIGITTAGPAGAATRVEGPTCADLPGLSGHPRMKTPTGGDSPGRPDHSRPTDAETTMRTSEAFDPHQTSHRRPKCRPGALGQTFGEVAGWTGGGTLGEVTG